MYKPFFSIESASEVESKHGARLCLEGHSLQVRHKHDWGRGFILLLFQDAVLPESDAGNDFVKPASSFVIQSRQISCSMWCPIYGARYYNVVWGLFRGAALAIR